jgi:polyisoprenoid-binding protein YceI
MLQRTLLAAALALASTSAFAAAETYTIDGGHTQTLFTWNHFGYSNPSANFDRIDGTISYDPADISKSSVDVTIAIDSINTHVPKLDTHMKSPDMFDAAKFPTATFKSTRVEKGSTDGTFKVTGDLTIHGVTKPVVLDAKLNRAGDHPMKKIPTIGFDASTTIKRSDYGIDFMVPSVSDEIHIRITTEAALPKVAAK